ncbi:hypothetical protein BGX27_006632, partial [Mortierella sp. AM989]
YYKEKNEADLEITEDWLRGVVDMDDFADEDVDDEVKGDMRPDGDVANNVDSGKENDQEDGPEETDAQVDKLGVATPEVEDVAKQMETDTKVQEGKAGGRDDTLIIRLNDQVGDLKSQVGNLQKQLTDQQELFQRRLADQMTSQQEQVQRQFEELKNLLLRPSPQ